MRRISLSAPRGEAAAAKVQQTGSSEYSLLLLNIVAVLVIAALDAVTPAGIVVGVLMVAPILASSLSNRPRDVVWTFAVAAAAYAAATLFGISAHVPGEIRLANRILVVMTLAASAYMGALFQQRRRLSRSEVAHLDATQMNRLLLSLIVHDLRSPLVTALHTLEYLESRVTGDDQAMIEESRARLRRNLRLVDAYLAVAHADRDGRPQAERTRTLTTRQLSEVLNDEIGGFRPEAVTRNKQLLLYHELVQVSEITVDVLVMRHALTILLDNAVRYAMPGPIRVTVSTDFGSLIVAVEDSGPGATGRGTAPAGAGLGLELCSSLLQRAGGKLELTRNAPDGSCFVMHLPLQNSAAPVAASS